MHLSVLLGLLGLTLVLAGFQSGGWMLLSGWLGCNFLALAVAHRSSNHGLFGKQPDGTLPLWSWLVFMPLHGITMALWHLLRLLVPEPAFSVVSSDLVIGRRLLPSEIEGEFANYVDLAAEFPEPARLRGLPSYISFPVLDASAPTTEALGELVARLRPGRTYIHCAQGHGRTGTVALAVLLSSGRGDLNEALELIQRARPGVRLGKKQHRLIRLYAEQLLKPRPAGFSG